MTGKIVGDLKLPKHLRSRLKIPFGDLITKVCDLKDKLGIDLANKSINANKIICVGDRVCEVTVTQGIVPDICVYDGKIMRRVIEIPDVIRDLDAIEIHAKNPAGYLSSEAFNAMEEALMSESNVKIIIAGEEDLVTLAAIDLAPLGSIILYGQPNEGMVVVMVNKNIKKVVKEILKEMEI